MKPEILDLLERSPEGDAAKSIDGVSKWMVAIALECKGHISPELDFASVMLSWDEVIEGLRAGGGRPVEAARWISVIVRESPRSPLLARSAVRKATDDPDEQGEHVCFARIPDSASGTLERFQRWTGFAARNLGNPDSMEAWSASVRANVLRNTGNELVAAWTNFALYLKGVEGAVAELIPSLEPRWRPSLHGEYCGLKWYTASCILGYLHVTIDIVKSRLADADKLPDSHLPLDQRWRARASLLVEELEAQWGRRRDRSYVEGRAAVRGAWMTQATTKDLELLAQLHVRATSLHSGLVSYWGQPMVDSSSSGASEPALRDVHWTILEELATLESPITAPELHDRINALPKPATLARRLRELEDLDYVDRPLGEKSGYAITDRGRARLAKRESNDPPM